MIRRIDHAPDQPDSQTFCQTQIAVEVGRGNALGSQFEHDTELASQFPERTQFVPGTGLYRRVITNLKNLPIQFMGLAQHPGKIQRLRRTRRVLPEKGVGSESDHLLSPNRLPALTFMARATPNNEKTF